MNRNQNQNQIPKRRPQPVVHRRKKRKKKKNNYLPLIMFIGIIIALLILILRCTADDELPETPGTERIVSMSAPEQVVTEPPSNVTELDDEIYSFASILYSITDNKIICGKNMEEITYPASLTKIMTAIIAIESIPVSDYFDKYITLDADIFSYISSANASVAGFKEGESVRVIDLLYGVMLPSGADASIGLARYIAGSESAFADLMNEKAAELGCIDTHFVNSTGLHDINHRTTARDILTILKYALKNDLFRTIFTTDSYTTGETNMRAEGLTFRSTVFRAFTNNGYEIGNVIGGKTGYTIEAKLCLATLAKTPTKEYILITLGAGEGDNQTAYHVMDAIKIYDDYT